MSRRTKGGRIKRVFKRFVSSVTGRFMKKADALADTEHSYERTFVVIDKGGEPLGIGA